MVATIWGANHQCMVVSRLATFYCGYPLDAHDCVSNLAAIDAQTFVCAVPMKSNTINETGTYPYEVTEEGFDDYVLELDGDSLHLPTSVQGELILSGGVPAVYDGERLSEYGFHFGPVLDTHTTEGHGAGSLTASTLYQWVAVYSWVDSRGVRHQSWLSNIISATTTAAVGAIEISFLAWHLSLTEHEDTEDEAQKVQIEIYRSGGTTDGLFHLEQTVVNVRDGAPSYVYSRMADADIESKQILYTDGGVLQDTTAPACKHIAACSDRVWLISCDDEGFLWHTKINGRDHVMPGWNTDFVQRTDIGGGCTALATIDDKLIVFKESTTWLFVGDPPNNQGLGGSLNGPTQLSASVGCTDARSVVSCPMGVAFRSLESIYMLTRGMSVEKIGAAIDDTLATYPVITGAAHDEGARLVLFTATTAAGTTGCTLVWHYELDQWMVWKTEDHKGTVDAAPISAAICSRAGTPYYHQAMDGSAELLYMTPSTYGEHSANQPLLTVETPWLSFAWLQGFQRIRRLKIAGKYRGNHAAIVRLRYDWEAESYACMRSIAFDGTNDYVEIGNVAELDFDYTDSFTISGWFKANSGVIADAIIGKALGALTYRGWFVRIESTGRLSLSLVNDYATANSIIVTTTHTVNDGKWHHIVFRYTGAVVPHAANVEIDFDGAVEPPIVVSDALTGTIVAAGIAYLGRMSSGSSLWAGNLCEIAVWDSVLADAVVDALWNTGRPTDADPGTWASPVGYWKCGGNETDGYDIYPDVEDYGAGNDGVMTNMDAGDIVMDVPGNADLMCWNAAQIAALKTDGDGETLDIHVPRQRCESMRVKVITRSEGAGTARQVRWESMAFQIGMQQRGLAPKPEANRR